MTRKTADKLPNMHSTTFRGMPIIIEWPAGSTRVGEREDGTSYKTEMKCAYGYVPGTDAAEDDGRLDVYIGPDEDAEFAYAIEQLKDDGEFDEWKVMLGFNSLEDAEAMYLAHNDKGWEKDHIGDITEVPFDYLFDTVEQHKAASVMWEGEGEVVPKDDVFALHAEFTGEGFKSHFNIALDASLRPFLQQGLIEQTDEGLYRINGLDALKKLQSRLVKTGAYTPDYEAEVYIEWGGQYDHRHMELDGYKNVYEWTDNDASSYLDLGHLVGECTSVDEAKSKLEEAVFRLGEPGTYIQFPEGPIKKEDYLNPKEKNFLEGVGVSRDIKPDYSDLTPRPKPATPEFDEADKARLKGMGVIGSKHTVIDAFIKNYEHEVDFYQECAALAQDKLDQALQEAGIKAVVSARAKRPQRLEKKLHKRQGKKQYQSFRDIYDDIVDLAGVRVALYLPADRDHVGKIIDQLFVPVRPPKTFPKDRGEGDSLGYIATHYRVRLRPESLRRKELRYADTQIEVQVASVLMHAFSELSHDLIYKPEKGPLTTEELNILNELNELVQEGEAQLEKLQNSIEGRQGEDLRFEITSALIKIATRLKAGLNE